MTGGPGPRFPRTEATQPFVEVLAAHLNPEAQIQQLRAALAELRSPGAPADDPDLTTARPKSGRPSHRPSPLGGGP